MPSINFRVISFFITHSYLCLHMRIKSTLKNKRITGDSSEEYFFASRSQRLRSLPASTRDLHYAFIVAVFRLWRYVEKLRFYSLCCAQVTLRASENVTLGFKILHRTFLSSLKKTYENSLRRILSR